MRRSELDDGSLKDLCTGNDAQPWVVSEGEKYVRCAGGRVVAFIQQARHDLRFVHRRGYGFTVPRSRKTDGS